MEIKERLLEYRKQFDSVYESAKKKFFNDIDSKVMTPLAYAITGNFDSLIEAEYRAYEIDNTVKNLLEIDSLDTMLGYLYNLKQSRTEEILNNYGKAYVSGSALLACWQCKFRVDSLLVTNDIPLLEKMINEEKRRNV